MDSASLRNVRAVQTVFMAPVLLAFMIGSLPVLLPAMLYRRFARQAQKPVLTQELQTAAPVAAVEANRGHQSPERISRSARATMPAGLVEGIAADPA